MASKRLTKQEMRKDEFRSILSEVYFGAVRHLEQYWRAYLIGLAVVLVIGGAAYYFQMRSAAKQDKSSHLLAQVIEAFNAPVEANPKDPNSKQLTFKTEKEKTDAIQARMKALEPEQAGPTKALYTFYSALGQARGDKLAEAVTTVTPLTKDPRLAPQALVLRARLYEAQSQWDKAEADWKSLAELDNPSWPAGEGWCLLGEYYERRGDTQKAVESYEKAKKSVTGEEAKDDALVNRAQAKLEALKGKA
jgi:tetratricopeptide (TPR) repeat protein